MVHPDWLIPLTPGGKLIVTITTMETTIFIQFQPRSFTNGTSSIYFYIYTHIFSIYNLFSAKNLQIGTCSMFHPCSKFVHCLFQVFRPPPLGGFPTPPGPRTSVGTSTCRSSCSPFARALRRRGTGAAGDVFAGRCGGHRPLGKGILGGSSHLVSGL